MLVTRETVGLMQSGALLNPEAIPECVLAAGTLDAQAQTLDIGRITSPLSIRTEPMTTSSNAGRSGIDEAAHQVGVSALSQHHAVVRQLLTGVQPLGINTAGETTLTGVDVLAKASPSQMSPGYSQSARCIVRGVGRPDRRAPDAWRREASASVRER